MSIVVREIPEPKENILGVIESYVLFSSVLNPKPPGEFLMNRNYSNGAASAAGVPTNKSDAGDYADKRLKELKSPDATTASKKPPADIEIRLKPPGPQPNNSK